MNKIVITICILFLSVTLYSQKDRGSNYQIHIIDSLLKETQAAMLSVDIDKTIELSSEALELSTNANYHEGMIRSYFVIGQALFNCQKYKEALSYLSRADKVRERSKHPLYMSQIYKVKGQIYFYLNVNDKSLDEFLKAINVAKKITNSDHRGYITSQIYESISVVYSGIGDTASWLHYMKLNLKLLESMDESFIFHNKINLLTSFGSYFIVDDKLDSAKYYIDQSLKLINQYDYRYKVNTLKALGDLYFQQSEFDLALDAYLQSIDNSEELGMMALTPEIHHKIAMVYEKLIMIDSVGYHLERKMFFENEFLKEKVNTTDDTLQILLAEEKSIERSKRGRILILTIIFTILIGVLLSRTLWRRRRNIIIDEMSKETKKEISQRLNMAFDEVMNLAKTNNPSFIVRFQEVYCTFYNNLMERHPDLTVTELQLCAMTYLNIPTVDIAEYTFVEVRSVQTRRSRLRKRINLPSDVDLLVYLKTLE